MHLIMPVVTVSREGMWKVCEVLTFSFLVFVDPHHRL